MIEQIEQMCSSGNVSTDVITAIFRGRGVAEGALGPIFDEMVRSGRYTVRVERNIPFLIPT